MAASTGEVLNGHLEAFGKQDLQALLSDYTDASVLLLPDGSVLHGPAEIKPLAEKFFAEFAKPGMSFEMVTMTTEGEMAYIVWKAETADNVYEMASDTMVIRDGKIAAQTMALKVAPKH